MYAGSSATDAAALLCAFQFADSFFPGGGISLSWGLEQLRTDGEVGSEQELTSFIEGQLTERWACFDAPALKSAWHAAGDLARLRYVDSILEAMTLPAELRDGSRRTGSTLLNVHARLGNDAAKQFRSLVLEADTPGHLAVVQGLVWQQQGVAEQTCRAMAAHLLVTGLVSAALRLGMIGHLQAQVALLRLRPVIAGLLAAPVADIEDVSGFTPVTEIASMRHETAQGRLFAN